MGAKSRIYGISNDLNIHYSSIVHTIPKKEILILVNTMENFQSRVFSDFSETIILCSVRANCTISDVYHWYHYITMKYDMYSLNEVIAV